MNRVCHAEDGNDASGRFVRIQIIQAHTFEIETLEGEAGQAQCPDFDEYPLFSCPDNFERGRLGDASKRRTGVDG
jgi:hypothetical protein